MEKLLNWGTLVVAAVLLTGAALNRFDTMGGAGRTVAVGDELTLDNVVWSTSPHTLVLALQPNCTFTEASVPFYRDLLSSMAAAGTPAILVTPHPLSVATHMLASYGLSIAESRQARFSSIGVPGSPTLLLVGKDGRVKDSWVGRLSPSRERDVFQALGIARISGDTSVASEGTRLTSSSSILRDGSDLLLLDTREREDIRRSPVPGALVIPINELEARITHEVPKNQPLLAVCDYCAKCGTPGTQTLPSRCDTVGRLLHDLGYSQAELVGTAELDARAGDRQPPS
jgi:hypothetical protein